MNYFTKAITLCFSLLKEKESSKFLLSLLFISLLSNTLQAQGNNCANANPFCGNAAYQIPSVTNNSVASGPNYGCLNDPALNGMQNPSWHYFQVDQSGTIQIDMIQTASDGSSADIDFTMWGPFTSLTAGCSAVMSGSTPPIQCSTAPTNTETMGLGVAGGSNYWYNQGTSSLQGQSTPPAAQAGEIYIVVTTNAANTTGTLTFNQTSGTGSTNCNIVVPDNCNISNLTATAVCNGTDATISGSFSVATSLTTGTLTVSSSCGGSQVFNAPFPSTSTVLNYTFNGGAGDGSTCTVTAVFSADATCTATASVTKPNCGCALTVSPVNASLCVGETTTLTANETGGTWSTSDASVATVVNGDVTAVANGTASITYTNGACTATSQITVSGQITPTFTNPGPICSGASFVLPTTSAEGIAGTWSPAIDNTQTTTYTFTPSAGVCAPSVTMEVVVSSQVTPLFDNPGPICSNETFTLPTTSINGITGAWTPAVDNSQTTTYIFVPTGSTCATNTAMTVVVNSINTTSDVTATKTTVTEGDNTSLNVTLTPYIPGILYSWNPTSTLNCTDCPNPIATPNSAGWYTVTITTPEGCKFKDSIYIDYRIICGEVYIPNIFSPNGDGSNDVFKPYGRCLKSMQFTIYDRWGEKIFYTDDITEGWDGTFRGKPMNSGTYVYLLTATLLYGDTVEMKGSVTLVR